MDPSLIILLFVVGLAFLFAEPFIPAGGLLGLAGLVIVLVSVYFGFRLNAWLGGAQILVGVVFGVISVQFFLRRLSHTDAQKASPPAAGEFDGLVGQTGEALTPLRPSGTALIRGRRVSVLTRGEMIDGGFAVRVAEVRGNRVIVEEAKDATLESPKT